MTDDNEIKQVWDMGLVDSEAYFIGEIVAHWGAIEHEVFIQTLMTFDDISQNEIQLPRAMNNRKFFDVLKLWKERVIDTSKGERRAVLDKQYDKINDLKDFRNALVHGMWEWDKDNPDILVTTRIRKKEIIKTKFMPGDLHNFSTELAQINLLIRYPGGMSELLKEQVEQGGYVNHAAMRRLKIEKDK